mgnify:FL=1
MTPEAKDLIEKLLTIDPTKRLGAGGVHEIQFHPWFKGSYFLILHVLKAYLKESTGKILGRQGLRSFQL